MAWSILGLQAPISRSTTEYILNSNDFGGSQVRLTGTGFTYDVTTGIMTGGSITGAALVKSGETVQTVTFTTALSGVSFYSFFGPAATLRAQVLSWGATAADVAEYESPNVLRVYAQNGTSLVFEGSGFSSFTNNGTVTAMKHYDANGVLLQTVTAGMPMALGVAAAAIGGDRGWYHYMTSGNNTVTHVSTNYAYEIDGGTGNDAIVGLTSVGLFVPVSYKQALSAETIDLTEGTATGAMGTDTLTNIQNVFGSNFNDSITGNGNANYIDGDFGNDTLSGLAGDDRLYGNVGNDTLLGGLGNDILGGGVGDDTINGGDGIDTADYEDYNSSIAGVTISLLFSGQQNTGGQGFDTLVGIENIYGSIYADTITGNSGANILNGGAGIDNLDGGGGADTLDGGIGADRLFGGDGDDRIIWDAGDDLAKVLGGTGTDTLVVTVSAVPTSFNLAAHEFEGAESELTLATGATELDIYNSSWQRTQRTISETDGHKSNTRFDPTDAQNWAQIDDNFNPGLVYASQFGYYDTGEVLNRWVAQFNLDGNSDYIYNYYDTPTRLDYSNGRFDDGRTFLEDNDQTDTNNSVSSGAGDWSTKYAVNDANGLADYQYDYYDDGTRSYLEHDQNNETTAYRYQYTFYDANGIADYLQGVRDNGDAYFINL